VVRGNGGVHHVNIYRMGRAGTGPCGRERLPGDDRDPRSCSPSPYSR